MGAVTGAPLYDMGPVLFRVITSASSMCFICISRNRFSSSGVIATVTLALASMAEP